MINNFYTALPAQKLPESKKGKSWREQCVDSIVSFGQSRSNGRTTTQRKKTNYDLVNSIFDFKDLQYILDPYGEGSEINGSGTAKMRCMNIIAAKLNLLKGEETARPFDFTVVAKNGEAVDAKEQKKKDILMQVANSIVERAAGIQPQEGEEQPQTFSEAERYIKMSLKDIREEWGNAILEHLKEDQKLKLRFNEGWEHALVAGEEIYYVGIVGKEPRLRTVNPINFEFDKNPDDPTIENGDWAREERPMSLGQIIDEYGEFLTDAQITQLEERSTTSSASLSNTMYPGYAYTQSDIDYYSRSTNNVSASFYTVTTVVWKSLKKIGFLTYTDPESGEPIDTMVDEGFKLSIVLKEIGAELEWRWITEVWKGTQITDDIYVDINPLPYQLRSMDNPYESKLPYIGRVYNATNSISTSLVDLMRPYQDWYNILWYRVEAEIAKSKGKKFVMDLALVPKTQGWNMDKWMYHFDTHGIAYINSLEEGRPGDPNSVSKFNQFTSIDMAMSQTVGQYIGLMDKIEDMLGELTGVNRQRQGQTFSSETTGGIERAVSQSSYITEPYFYAHNETKKQVLTQLLEVAKIAYDGSKKIHYILDDMQRIFLDIDMDKFSDSEYGVFVSNSMEDKIIYQKIEQLAQAAMQNGTLKFADLIKMYKTKSISRLSADLELAEEKRMQEQQAQAQQQNEIAQAQLAQQAADKQADRDNENMNKQLDRQNKIDLATLTGLGFSEDKDIDNDGTPDIIEQSKIALKQSEIASKQLMQSQKLQHESSEASKDRSLEKEKIQADKEIAKTKIKSKPKS
jgi:hypothetical protein